MKFKKAVFLHALIVCASLNILQGPLCANDPENFFNTEEEVDTAALMQDDNEAQKITKGSTSFFSKYKNSIKIGVGVAAAATLAGLGYYYFWKPNDQDYLSKTLPKSTQSTSIEDLQKKVGRRETTPTKYDFQFDLSSLNLCVKKAQAVLAEAGSSMHDQLAKFDQSFVDSAKKTYEKAMQEHPSDMKEYARDMKLYKKAMKNHPKGSSDQDAPVEPPKPEETPETYTKALAHPLFKKLRADVETVLSQSSDITKEQVHFLVVLFIRATQTYIKDNAREELAHFIMQSAEDKLKKAKDTLKKAEKTEEIEQAKKELEEAKKELAQVPLAKGIIYESLDSLCSQSADAWATILEKILSIRQSTQAIAKKEQDEYTDKRYEWNLKTGKLLKEMSDEQRYQFLQGWISQLKSSQIPEGLKEIINVIPVLSTLFPEVQGGTIPPLVQPIMTFLARYHEIQLPENHLLSKDKCWKAIDDFVNIAAGLFEIAQIFDNSNSNSLFKKLPKKILVGLTKKQLSKIREATEVATSQIPREE